MLNTTVYNQCICCGLGFGDVIHLYTLSTQPTRLVHAGQLFIPYSHTAHQQSRGIYEQH